MGNVTSTAGDSELAMEQTDMNTLNGTENDQEQDNDSPLDLANLFDIAALRSIASKVVTTEDVSEDIITQHRELIIRWLEEFLQNESVEFVTLSEFYDLMSTRGVCRNDCLQAFHQFDADGMGHAEARHMLKVLENNGKSGCVRSNLETVVRTLRSSLFTPGFFDIYNEEEDGCDQHASNIMNFLLKNRASSLSLPLPALNGYNNMIQLRQSALNNLISRLKKSPHSLHSDTEVSDEPKTEVMSAASCIASYEVSSNKVDAHKLFLPDTYWQSDGVARSHWIRLAIKNGVIVRQLHVSVSANDRSYMPQDISISVGSNPRNLHEIKSVHLHSFSHGNIQLLDNYSDQYYPIVQININRCQNDGCDTRIHGIKLCGYRTVHTEHSSGVTVADSLLTWYLQVMASTVCACLPLVPQLQATVLEHSRIAVENMPPLSLAPASLDRPECLTGHVLKELDGFLLAVTRTRSNDDERAFPKGLRVLLGFHVAQGNIAGMLKTLVYLRESGLAKLSVGNLLVKMDAARHAFWKKNGGAVELKLVGCDGDQKEAGVGPENVLRNSWSSTQLAYLSGNGKTQVNMFFRAKDHVQLTKIKIKIDKGPCRPRCGMVFVYRQEEEFVLDDSLKSFECCNSWRQVEYDSYKNTPRVRCPAVLLKYPPVAFFTADKDCDEIDVPVEDYAIGQYVLIKFLEPQQSSADRLGIVGIKFFGYERDSVFVNVFATADEPWSVNDSTLVKPWPVIYSRDPWSNNYPWEQSPLDYLQELDNLVTSDVVCIRCLSFLTSLVRDQSRALKKAVLSGAKSANVSFTGTTVKALWDAFTAFEDSCTAAVLVLHLLHALLPLLSRHINNSEMEVTQQLFDRLCSIVDDTSTDPSSEQQTLRLAAQQVIVDGAAVFFPDKNSRSFHLFKIVKDINAPNERPSVALKFQSLCHFFSKVDPSGLLQLPTLASPWFDVGPVMSIMETLVSVAYRECQAVMDANRPSDKLPHLIHLLCSLQTSILAWCSWQINDRTRAEKEKPAVIAQTILIQYVELFAPKVAAALEKFYGYTTDEMISLLKHLQGSLLSTTFPQLVLLLSFIGDSLSRSSRSGLLTALRPITEHFHNIARKLPTVFHGAGSDYWSTMERPEEVLKIWDMESTHKYENNQHTTQVFTCPGAMSFLVEFDPRCETERSYDYLEFTDSQGTKTRYDYKVNTDKWPLTKVFSCGPRLHFLFHSDSSNNEWGYKFRVSARGRCDEPLCWIHDAYLSLSKLVGKLCGANLDVTHILPRNLSKPVELSTLIVEQRMTIFRGGKLIQDGVEEECESLKMLKCLSTRSGPEAETFINKVQEHYRTSCSTMSLGGAEVDEVVIAAFAALIWHSQSLRDEFDKYVKHESDDPVSDGFHQAYAAAETLRMFIVEERQKLKLTMEKSTDKADYDPAPVTTDKARYLLQFAGLTKLHLKSEARKFDCSAGKHHNLPGTRLKADSSCEKYPSFRLVLDFLRDSAWNEASVEELLCKRVEYAEAVSLVYTTVHEFLQQSANSTDVFQIHTVLMLQELLRYEDKFGRHYADGMDGCGPALELSVRSAYYRLVKYLMDSIRAANRIEVADVLELPINSQCYYDFVVVCTLHLLDVSWKLHNDHDLAFLAEVKMTEFFQRLAVGSIAIHEAYECLTDEAMELGDHKMCMSSLEESKADFDGWYSRQTKDKQVQLFIARYCSLLSVSSWCDGCGCLVAGHRYRCLECVDIDLCANCFNEGVMPIGTEHHISHDLAEFEFQCDSCHGFIVGSRVHCEECPDFDLCLCCQHAPQYPHGHTSSHSVKEYPLLRIKTNEETYSVVQSYVHQHVWLQYSSLALTVASFLQSRHHPEAAGAELFESCVTFAIKCFQRRTEVPADIDPSFLSGIHQQQMMFTLHEQEKISGLLGAMIPASRGDQSRTADDVNRALTSEHLITVLFCMLQCDCNAQRFAFGLIRRLLINVSTSFQAIDQFLKSSMEPEEPAETLDTVAPPEGSHTVRFLFTFGAMCLDKFGLEWTSSVVMLLRELYGLPRWRDAIVRQLSSSIAPLTENCSSPAIFSLFVIAGFPYLLSFGARVRFAETGAELRSGIVVKQSENMNQVLAVETKTRRRKQLKVETLQFICSDAFNCCVSECHISKFIDIICDIAEKLKSEQAVAINAIWVLSLALKSVAKVTQADGCCQQLPELFEPRFVKAVSSLAMLGTGFSRHWIVTDLEILALSLYGNDIQTITATAVVPETVLPTTAVEPSTADSPDPLEGLDETAKQTFHTLHNHLKIKYSVLRAFFETVDKDTQNLMAVLNISTSTLDSDYLPTDKAERKAILEVARKWEKPTSSGSSNTDLQADVDRGVHFSASNNSPDWTDIDEVKECTEETMDEIRQLIDNGKQDDILTQRRSQSSVLLKAELEKQSRNVTGVTAERLFKIHHAVAVLYAREMLIALLADWPTTGHEITADLLGCCSSENLPFVLDLLYHTESADMFKNVVRNVIRFWQCDGFRSVARIACNFMSERNAQSVIRESPHLNAENEDYDDERAFEVTDSVHIPGATFLHITFDPRCCTEENDDELVMSRSADLKTDRHVFGGGENNWTNFDLHGDTLYYRFSSDYIGSDWGFRFSVSGGLIGRFETGYLILRGLLSTPNAASLLPLDVLWQHLISITCRQSGQHRQKTIHLLLTLIASQSKIAGVSELSIDLGLLAPLWRLHSKMLQTANSHTSSAVRAFTELFYCAEDLALEWNIGREYVAMLSLDDFVRRAVLQGLKNVAAVSLAINYYSNLTNKRLKKPL